MCPFAYKVGGAGLSDSAYRLATPTPHDYNHLTFSADGDSQLNPAVVDTVLTGIPGPRGPPGPPGE